MARLYEIGTAPFGATTLASKFTKRSPEMLPDRAPMLRPGVLPSRFNIFGRRLGWGRKLLRSWVTGWLELAIALNSGMTFCGLLAETTRKGKYPEFGFDFWPVLEP